MSRTGVFLNSEGDAVERPVAPESGRYLDENGTGRHVQAGDPIPPGWTPADDGGPKPPGKPAKGKAKKAPAENK